MRKAQLIGQVFVLVIAAIVFILILAYGYSAISHFLQSSEQVAFLDFKTSLISAIEQIKPDFGSVRKLSLHVPKRYNKLCVVSSYPSEIVLASDFKDEYPVLFEVWQTGSENVFLLPKQQSGLFVSDVFVDKGYFCIDISRVVDLRIKGLGDRTGVSVW